MGPMTLILSLMMTSQSSNKTTKTSKNPKLGNMLKFSGY